MREDYIYELILIMWKDVIYNKDKELWEIQRWALFNPTILFLEDI